jgi:hypothetical protein
MIGALHQRLHTHRYFLTLVSLKTTQLQNVERLAFCIYEWFGMVNRVVQYMKLVVCVVICNINLKQFIGKIIAQYMVLTVEQKQKYQ